MYVSMIFMALPLTIIVGAFSKQYESTTCLKLKETQSESDLNLPVENEQLMEVVIQA